MYCGLVLHVFIEIVDGAEIAEVPVEGGAALFYAGGDAGHYYVAAIARIAGDGEGPGGVRRRRLRESSALNTRRVSPTPQNVAARIIRRVIILGCGAASG